MLAVGLKESVIIKNVYAVECWEHYHRFRGSELRCPVPEADCGLPVSRRHLRWADQFNNLVTTVGLNHIASRVIKGSGTGGASGGYNDGRRLPAVWAASTAYSVGDVVRASTPGTNNRFFIARVAGTSGGSEPTWPTSAGGEVTDNTVTWLEASQFYVGLVDNAGFSSYAAGDTMASHSGWSEGTPYSNSTRPAFTPGSVSGGSCDNSAAKAVFNINATLTVRGCFLCDFPTKGGTTGLLYGVGDFSGGSRAVQSGDTLNVQVTTSFS